jgi:uncharacterized protein YgbK (DUF1537 family)
MNKPIRIGCIADDFTGGSDAASFLAEGGAKVLLYSGVPDTPLPGDFGSGFVVVALKSRTAPREEAVKETLAAFRWLEEMGTEQYYLKYCSTFDSTPEGNIGPTVDAVLDALGEAGTILCPGLPVNGRTVKDGRLFVNGVPLEKSPMKDHPLTPMWDSRIARLMEPQGKYRPVALSTNRMSRDAACREIGRLRETGEKFYLIPDYETEADGEKLAEWFGSFRLLTGGSGILAPLARRCGEVQTMPAWGPRDEETAQRVLILAGSCSEMTRRQVRAFQEAGGRSVFADPARLLSGEQTEEDLWRFVLAEEGPVLVYSSDTPEHVRERQKEGAGRVAKLLEGLMASLAARAVDSGCRRIVSAGGETSGAVTKSLGYRAFYIGKSIAPGVPLLIPAEDPGVRLVLKSGNFGQEDFFWRSVGAVRSW